MTVSIVNGLNDADKAYVRDHMYAFNLKHFPEAFRGRYGEIGLFLKDGEGAVQGGLLGETCWNWMEIHYVFVREDVRRLGYGRQLLAEAERVARQKSCAFMKVDTLGFQALDFYVKQGFKVFGSIPNAGGHTHYYLTKVLEPQD